MAGLIPVSCVPLPINEVACTDPIIDALAASKRPVEIPATLNFPVSVSDEVVKASVLIIDVERRTTDEIYLAVRVPVLTNGAASTPLASRIQKFPVLGKAYAGIEFGAKNPDVRFALRAPNGIFDSCEPSPRK